VAGTKPHVVYWDACVFIAFLKGDRDAEKIKEALRYWTEEARAGRAKIITSALTYTEVLRFYHPSTFKAFREFMRRHVTVRAADHIVCGRASEYRSHFVPIETAAYEKRLRDAQEVATALARQKAEAKGQRAKRDPKKVEVPGIKSLRSPDAIHLATASLYDACTAFHTFDGEGKSKGTALRLLDLNGLLPGFSIPITLPRKPDTGYVDFFDDL
jgi:predicted nucleic acid-binding protein